MFCVFLQSHFLVYFRPLGLEKRLIELSIALQFRTHSTNYIIDQPRFQVNIPLSQLLLFLFFCVFFFAAAKKQP